MGYLLLIIWLGSWITFTIYGFKKKWSGIVSIGGGFFVSCAALAVVGGLALLFMNDTGQSKEVKKVVINQTNIIGKWKCNVINPTGTSTDYITFNGDDSFLYDDMKGKYTLNNKILLMNFTYMPKLLNQGLSPNVNSQASGTILHLTNDELNFDFISQYSENKRAATCVRQQ